VCTYYEFIAASSVTSTFAGENTKPDSSIFFQDPRFLRRFEKVSAKFGSSRGSKIIQLFHELYNMDSKELQKLDFIMLYNRHIKDVPELGLDILENLLKRTKIRPVVLTIDLFICIADKLADPSVSYSDMNFCQYMQAVELWNIFVSSNNNFDMGISGDLVY
jgi:hypothetical protein